MITLTENPPHHIWFPCLVPHRWVGNDRRGWHILWPCWGVSPYSEQEHRDLSRYQKCAIVTILVLGTWILQGTEDFRSKLSYIMGLFMMLVAIGVLGK